MTPCEAGFKLLVAVFALLDEMLQEGVFRPIGMFPSKGIRMKGGEFDREVSYHCKSLTDREKKRGVSVYDGPRW